MQDTSEGVHRCTVAKVVAVVAGRQLLPAATHCGGAAGSGSAHCTMEVLVPVLVPVLVLVLVVLVLVVQATARRQVGHVSVLASTRQRVGQDTSACWPART